MARIAFMELLLFLLPFIAWGLWRVLITGRGQFLDTLPGFWLSVVGLLLASLGFVALAFIDGAAPGQTYEPPHLEDGRVVPGRFGVERP